MKKHTAVNWQSTALVWKRLKGSPGIAVHSDILSRIIVFSIICAGTVLLLNTASFTIWQQASRTYTAWDTLCTDLNSVTEMYLTCHSASLVYMCRIFNNSHEPESQSYTFCVQCPAAFLALWSLHTWLCTWAVEENHWIGACWWQW